MKLAVLGQALSVPSQEVSLLPSEAPHTQTAPKITKTLPRSASEKPCWGEVEMQAGESQNPTCNQEHTC